MSDSTPNPTTQNVQINLRDMAGRYMGAVQRIFDLAASTIGSLRCQTEKDYDEFASLGRFMPSPQQHANFDTIRPVSEQWLLRNLLSEALGTLVPFLEDCRSVAALAEWKVTGSDQEKIQKILGEERQSFLRLGLPEKIAHLKEMFSVSSPGEGFLVGHLKLGQVLAKGGVVGDGDGNEGSDLVVTLTGVQLQPAQAGGQQQGRLVNVPKRFSQGQRVDLKKEEILALFASVAVFVTTLMGSLQQRVQTLLPNEMAASS
jgi:hypothetical protein